MKELWPRVRKRILESVIKPKREGRRRYIIVNKLEAFKNVNDHEKNLESILAHFRSLTKTQFLDSAIVHVKPGQNVREIVEKLSEESAECKNFRFSTQYWKVFIFISNFYFRYWNWIIFMDGFNFTFLLDFFQFSVPHLLVNKKVLQKSIKRSFRNSFYQ